MPRIPGPNPAQGPGQVISMPRAREVQARPTIPALKSPLVEFGAAMGDSGNLLLRHVVEQERSAVSTKLKRSAIEQFGALENEVDRAGTASQARALLDEQFPKILGRLERESADAGMPEVMGDLNEMGARSKISTLGAIGKRSAQEGADDVKALAAAYENRLAGARTNADYQGLRAELSTELERVAQTNPLMTPGDADALMQATTQAGAQRRVSALANAAAAAGDMGALRALQGQLDTFPDLPEDKKAALSKSIADIMRQEEARLRAEAHRAGAVAVSDLRIGIVRAGGPGALNDIIARTEELFAAGAIAPDTRASVIIAAENKKAGLLDGQIELADIMGRLEQGFGLNNQKEADKAYAAEAQLVAPEQQAAHLVDFTTRSGVPPSAATNLLSRAERMEEPSQLAFAASYVRAVQDRSYAAASRMEVGPRVESTLATSKVLGMPEEEAAQLVIDQGPDAAVRKARAEAFDSEFEDWEPREFLAGHDIAPEFWFSADTEVGDRLAIETESAMRRVWEMTGNREAAEQAAADMLKRRFATTQVGGRSRLTEVPPEPYGAALLQGNVDEEVVARAIDTEIEGLLTEAGVEPAPALAGMENQPPWELRADEQTRFDLAQGRPPSMQLWIRGDEFGNMRPVRDKGTGETVRYFMTADALKAQPPVAEAVRDAFRAAIRRQVTSAQEEVRLLEVERLRLQPQASAGIPGAADRLADIEGRLESAKRHAADVETRLGP